MKLSEFLHRKWMEKQLIENLAEIGLPFIFFKLSEMNVRAFEEVLVQ